MSNKLKISILTLDKKFETVEKEFSIDVSDFDSKTQEIWYKMHIPSHIYQKLLNTAPEYTVEKGFKPYIEFISVKAIIDTFRGYCNEIEARIASQSKPREKKIFVKFSHYANKTRCEWTGGYMGEIVGSKFQFFTGYKVMEPAGMSLGGEAVKMVPNYYTLIRYQKTSSLATVTKYDTDFKEGATLEPLHMKNSNDRASFEAEYAILDWTQEAEDFLNMINLRFKELHKYLQDFLGNLDNEKMQKLIQNNNFKLLK